MGEFPLDGSGESTGFRDFSPLNWSDFFEEAKLLDVDGDQFNVYFKGHSGPVFYLLHGGGFTGLTWACFVEELTKKVDCRIVAPDLRGHGNTKTTADDDLSMERQVKDIANIYDAIFGANIKKPPLILIGHSMGGALAIHTVHLGLLPNVQAVAVVDVVEGSAMGALSLMTQVLRNRPNSFQTLEKAVKWCFESGGTRNLRAAKISMPSQVVKREENGKEVYRWRINLSKTQTHWIGWFKGLSKLFLDCKPVKILILANVDRLDKELMVGLNCCTVDLKIGQMRGMFQYEVLPKVGHSVHEDSPDKFAEIFVNLVKRYKVIFDKC